jgi:hypothetical protein
MQTFGHPLAWSSQERVAEFLKTAPVDVKAAWKDYQERNPESFIEKLRNVTPLPGGKFAA